MENVKYRMLQEMLGGDFPEDYKAAVDAAIRIMPPGWEVFSVVREVTLRWGFDIKMRFTWPNDVRWTFGDVELHGCFMREYGGNMSTEHIAISRIHFASRIDEGDFDAASGVFRSHMTGEPLVYHHRSAAE